MTAMIAPAIKPRTAYRMVSTKITSAIMSPPPPTMRGISRNGIAATATRLKRAVSTVTMNPAMSDGGTHFCHRKDPDTAYFCHMVYSQTKCPLIPDGTYRLVLLGNHPGKRTQTDRQTDRQKHF